jgi:WD40 repeat protein
LTIGSGSLAGYLTVQTATAALPSRLFSLTLDAVIQHASGKALTSLVSAPVASLVEGGLKSMVFSKVVWLCLPVVSLILLTGGAGLTVASKHAEDDRAAAFGAEEEKKAFKPDASRQDASTPRNDLFGDRLPPKAIARLGTVRFNHGERLSSLHYTPDGQTIVSYGAGMVRLWDADTGVEKRQFAVYQSSNWSADQTALAEEGNVLLVLQDGGKTPLRFIDLRDGKELTAIELDPKYALASGRAVLAADGQYAAAPMVDGVHVFDTAGRAFRFRTNKRGKEVQAIGFSGDSKALIQSDKNGGIEVWHTATGKMRKLLDQKPPAVVLAASPDGRWLATLEHHTRAIDKILENDAIHLWDLREGKETRLFTKRGWFMRVFFTPDSKRLVAQNCEIGLGYSAATWEIDTGREIENRIPNVLFARAFHPDGKRFVHGRGKFDQWDFSSSKRMSFEDSPYALARAISFSPSADRLYTLDNHWLVTWDTATGKSMRTVNAKGYSLMDPQPIFSADGKWALSYEPAGPTPSEIALRVWDVAQGSAKRIDMGELPKKYINAHTHIVPAFTPDGKSLLALQPGWDQAAIRSRDLRTGEETKRVPETRAGWSQQAMLLADGKTLAIAGAKAVGIDIASGQEVFAWKGPVTVRDNQAKKTPDSDDGRPWRSFAISPDGRTAAYVLFTGYSGKPVPDRIILCDGRTGRLRGRLSDSGIAPFNGHEILLFSQDSRVLATTDGSAVHLSEAATGGKLGTLTGHRGEIRALAFSHHGRLLATASADSTVLVWDLTGRWHGGKFEPMPLATQDLEARWQLLRDRDAAKAYHVVWELAASADAAVRFLKNRLRPVPQPDPNHIAQLISALDGSFRERQAAQAELQKLGVLAEAALARALQGQPSLELRRRAESLLQSIHESLPAPDELQRIRAVAVLEQVAGLEAHQLLETLAQGAAGAHLTRAAQAALGRLRAN